ncbi:MAG TPA: hypothetical protein VF252_07855, partial [Gemmatimonadales bacterium]
HCVIVFVGLNAEGRATQVPKWKPSTELDLALEAYAGRLSELRRQMDAEMERSLGKLSGEERIR